MKFLQVTNQFIRQNDGAINSPYILSFLETNTGIRVCHKSAESVFPGLFAGTNFPILDLNANDFQEDYTRLPLTYNTKRIYSKVDDYYAKTCTITFIKGGEKRTKVLDMSTQTPTAAGYDVNLETTIIGE